MSDPVLIDLGDGPHERWELLPDGRSRRLEVLGRHGGGQLIVGFAAVDTKSASQEPDLARQDIGQGSDGLFLAHVS